MLMFVGAVTWFPQEHAHLFFMVKGSLALLATVLLIIHMSHTWHTIERPGQRLRYITLLAFGFLVAGSTVEQLEQDADVNYRNLLTLVCVLLLLAAMVQSIREDVLRHQEGHHA